MHRLGLPGYLSRHFQLVLVALWPPERAYELQARPRCKQELLLSCRTRGGAVSSAWCPTWVPSSHPSSWLKPSTSPTIRAAQLCRDAPRAQYCAGAVQPSWHSHGNESTLALMHARNPLAVHTADVLLGSYATNCSCLHCRNVAYPAYQCSLSWWVK